MAKKVEICPCCGQKIVEYRHNFNSVLFNGLKYLEYLGGKATLREIFDKMGMSSSEYANFQKLQYFDMMSKDGRNYVLTEKGEQFLKGRGTCPEYVVTKLKKVVEVGPEMTALEMFPPVQVKEEYEEQASVKKVLSFNR